MGAGKHWSILRKGISKVCAFFFFSGRAQSHCLPRMVYYSPSRGLHLYLLTLEWNESMKHSYVLPQQLCLFTLLANMLHYTARQARLGSLFDLCYFASFAG